MGSGLFNGDDALDLVVVNQENDDVSILLSHCCLGDINGDGKTDQSDMGILLAAYDSCDGDPSYNPAANLFVDQGTQCIDQQDMGILLADYYCGTEG